MKKLNKNNNSSIKNINFLQVEFLKNDKNRIFECSENYLKIINFNNKLLINEIVYKKHINKEILNKLLKSINKCKCKNCDLLIRIAFKESESIFKNNDIFETRMNRQREMITILNRLTEDFKF